VVMEQDHFKGKVEILEDNSQAWNRLATFCWRGTENCCTANENPRNVPEWPRIFQNLPEINLSLVICNLTNLYTRVHPKFVVLWHSLVSQSRPFTELPGMTRNLKF
jgi:hypothetical protein